MRASAIWLFSAIGFVGSCGLVHADERQVQRGKYLVGIVGCGDCHTPGHFFGKPDPSGVLSGSEVGFEVPQLGVFYGSNLTPDKETGLGNWSAAENCYGVHKGHHSRQARTFTGNALAGLLGNDGGRFLFNR